MQCAQTGISNIHDVETPVKLAMSFADGLDVECNSDDSESSWSNDASEDDSQIDASLVESDDDNSKSDSSESNVIEDKDESTSSITGNNDEIVDIFTPCEDSNKMEPVSNSSGDSCKSWQGDDSTESSGNEGDSYNVEHEGTFNDTDKLEKVSNEYKESGGLTKGGNDSILKTRRGLQRKPTGDSDTLGELLHGYASGRLEDAPPGTSRRGRRIVSGENASCGPEKTDNDPPKKEPMRTRRGVQRIPTGDSDTLNDMIHGARSVPNTTPKQTEPSRRGGRRKTRNDVQVEVVGIGEAVQLKEPLKTRRGVQRKATGDSDTLVALALGVDCNGKVSVETPKVRRGGRKKERTSNDTDIVDVAQITESKGPLRTRKGLRRQATGDSDTLADLIAQKRKSAASNADCQ